MGQMLRLREVSTALAADIDESIHHYRGQTSLSNALEIVISEGKIPD